MSVMGFRWAAVAVIAGAATLARGDDELKRRGYFGAALVASAGGVEVREVIAGSSAEGAGVRPGDVLAAVAGSPVRTPGEATAAIGKARSGETLAIDLVRDGAKLSRSVVLKERPREASETFDVAYGSIPSKAGRLRTILARPKAPGRHPALFLIQGYPCGSVEGSPARPGEYQMIADAFTDRGYVTLRVEKPGCGDSEGGPCAEVDFLTELDGYRQGLKMLKAHESVDPARVILFGHSLGGLWAPLVAADDPVKGVAVYGTVVKTWFEYELENRRRQLLLAGASFADVDAHVRDAEGYFHALFSEKSDPAKIIKDHPGLAEFGSGMSPDGVHIYGRGAEFLRQVGALRSPEAWSRVDAHVLAAWGTADFVSSEADHRDLADLVNRGRPGRATFVRVEGVDHGFSRATSPKDAFDRGAAGSPGAFDPAIVEALRAWADRVIAS